jgi:hypothetical protein
MDQGIEQLNLALNNEKQLSNWENPPKVMDLRNDYQEAKPTQDAQIVKIDTWLDNLNVTGSALVKTANGRSSIVPKLIRKQAEWRYASLSEPFLSSEDVFNVDPMTYEDKQGAVQNEMVLNYQFNTKLNKVKFIDEYVRTAVDEGTVIARVGWEFEEVEEEVEVPVMELQPTEDPQIVQLYQTLSQDPTQAQNAPPELLEAFELSMQAGIPLAPVQVGTEMQMQTVVKKNNPTVEVCNIKNVVIDPTCNGDIDKASFVIYSFETSLSELKKDGRYQNLDSIELTSASVLAEPDHHTPDDSAFTFKDKPRKKFVAYEYWGYWDIDNDGIAEPIVATWVNNTMIRLEENPFPDGKPPFVLVQYLPVRKSIYGEPDGSLLEDNQKILGAVTRGMIDIMGRSANGQMAIRKDALDVTNKRKFDKGLDYEFNAQVDPRQAFYMHTYPEIPQSAQYLVNLQNMEAESLTGVKAYASGISGQALGNTATGVRSALDAASKRELGILRRLAEGMKQIGRKIIAMNAEFLSEEEVIRVTNEEFVPVRRDDLAGNYDLRLNISTAEADNQKAEELAFMLQTTAQSMGPTFSQMILSEIARLRKMPDLAKKIAEFQPQPDPLVEQQKQLEVELLAAQAANEAAKAEENQIDKELKIAKLHVEMAQAKAIKSKSDLDDLEFLEREKGIDHNKVMEEIRAKVEGDILKERSKYLNQKAKGSDE